MVLPNNCVYGDAVSGERGFVDPDSDWRRTPFRVTLVSVDACTVKAARKGFRPEIVAVHCRRLELGEFRVSVVNALDFAPPRNVGD